MEEKILNEIRRLEPTFFRCVGVPVSLLVRIGTAIEEDVRSSIKTLWLKDKITLNFTQVIDGKYQSKPARELFSTVSKENKEVLSILYFTDDKSFLGLFVSSV